MQQSPRSNTSVDTSNLSVGLGSHVTSQHYSDIEKVTADKFPPPSADEAPLHSLKPGERSHRDTHTKSRQRAASASRRRSSSPSPAALTMYSGTRTNGRRRDDPSGFSRTHGVSHDVEEDSDHVALRHLLADPDDHDEPGVEYVPFVSFLSLSLSVFAHEKSGSRD